MGARAAPAHAARLEPAAGQDVDLWDANIASRVNQRPEPVVGYHAGRPWSLLASTAVCVSLLACWCLGWTVIATAKLSSFSFATN